MVSRYGWPCLAGWGEGKLRAVADAERDDVAFVMSRTRDLSGKHRVAGGELRPVYFDMHLLRSTKFSACASLCCGLDDRGDSGEQP